MTKDLIKNIAIVVFVILALGGWISFFTKDNKGAIKQLEAEKKILADSIEKVAKSNERITSDLNRAHENTAQDSLAYENELKRLKELVSRIQSQRNAHNKNLNVVKRFTSTEVDSAYTANLNRYAKYLK